MIEIKKYTIKVTILLKDNLWIGLFERNDQEGYAVSRKVFGDEPTDAQLYDFVLTHFDELKFTEPCSNIKLIIKRKNPKRLQHEVRHEMKKAKESVSSATFAQEILRLDIEKNKKTKKIISKQDAELMKEKKFQLKQEKRKKKHRGH